MYEAEQDVLGTDVVVVQHPGFFLSQHHNPSRPVGKPFEHYRRSLTKAVGTATATARPFRAPARAPGKALATMCCSRETLAHLDNPPHSSRAFPSDGAFTLIQPVAREQCSQVRRERTQAGDGTPLIYRYGTPSAASPAGSHLPGTRDG